MIDRRLLARHRLTVRAVRQTADYDDPSTVIEEGETGEVVGTGFIGTDGREWVAVDFGDIIADVPSVDLHKDVVK